MYSLIFALSKHRGAKKRNKQHFLEQPIGLNSS